jgi:hypothetical protein
MKKLNDNILLILAFIFLLGAVLLMMSCSATKRVLRDPAKTEKVAVEYIKKNPRKNDTTFIPGSTVIKEVVTYDTVPLPYPVNEKYTERHFKEVVIRDTVKIESREFENGLIKRIDALEIGLAEMKQSRNEWRTESWIWRGIAFALLAFFILKPFIKSYIKF